MNADAMWVRIALFPILIALSACVSNSEFKKSGWFEVSPGETVRIYRASHLDSKCNFLLLPEGTIVDEPSNGTMVYKKMIVSPDYKPDNPRYKCNSRRGLGGAFFYTPKPGFTGQDFARLRQPYTDGTVIEMVVNIDVRAR